MRGGGGGGLFRGRRHKKVSGSAERGRRQVGAGAGEHTTEAGGEHAGICAGYKCERRDCQSSGDGRGGGEGRRPGASSPIMMGRNLRMAWALCWEGSWLCCGGLITFWLMYCGRPRGEEGKLEESGLGGGAEGPLWKAPIRGRAVQSGIPAAAAAQGGGHCSSEWHRPQARHPPGSGSKANCAGGTLGALSALGSPARR